MNIPDFTSITLAKALGNPNHDPGTGEFASFGTSISVEHSAAVNSMDSARQWWAENLGGKVAGLQVHIGRKNSEWGKILNIKVEFPENETHAFTEKSAVDDIPDCHDDEKRKQRPRKFVEGRAKLMDRIVQTIEYPKTKAVQYGADLLFERQIGGQHFVVALTWSDARKLYVFDSAYVMAANKVRDLLAHQDARKNNGPLQKSEPSGSAPSVFRDSTESGIYPTGSKPVTKESIGFCRCCNDTLVDLILFSKSYVVFGGEMGDFIKADFTDSSPTQAQSEAGNYAKRKMAWCGLTISIENEPGSIRKGKGWQTKMLYAYGYINKTEAADGEQIDVYVGPDESSDTVYVVHQRKYGDWAKYDEDKCFIQFSSEAAARAAYLKHYDDPRFLGPITAMPVDEFVEKARKANGRMVKSITLIFQNGNEHAIFQGDYSFDAGNELLKAQQLGAGQRWITVNAHRGADGKGTRLLVQETKSGSGVYHAIGGAGGALNYMKFRGLAPESSYKEQVAEKAKQRSVGKKQQRVRDKELGIGESKSKARASVRSQKNEAAHAYIAKIADKMRWKPEDLEPRIPENTSEATRNKLVQKHHGELLKRVDAAVELQHQNLLTDAQARDEALGQTVEPSDSTPAHKLDVSDLDDARPSGASSLGFSAHYAARAAEQGADESIVKQEAGAKKEARQANLSEGQRAAIKTRGDTAQQVKSEIANIREPITSNVKAVLASAKDAVDMITARKEFKATLKAAGKAMKEIDEAVEEVKAMPLDVVVDTSLDSIADDIEKDIRTIRTEAFLTAVKKDAPDYEKSLRQHIGAGAFNSINALALTAGGAALVDRSVVDVLGIAGAAQVLARRLHADLPEAEMSKLTDGMEAFHLHHYMETSKDAMQEAQELHDAAKEIQLGEASHGGDFEAARELLHRRNACVEKAHQILGTALGEMEANAALVTALKGGRADKPLEVPLGKIADEDAIRQVRAIGLQRGDYSIDRVAGNQVLTITPEGLDRLSKPVDRKELERTRNTLDILNGGQDEDNWLPQGFAKRPDLALDLKPGVAATLAKSFNPSGDIRQSIKDYIGGRAADGDSPDAIMQDLQSADFFQKSGSGDAYRDALDDIAARTGEDGKLLRNEDLAETFNKYAEEYANREYGGKLSPIQRQNFEPDAVAQDALHRALSDTPEGIAAYKPIGELSNDDQQTLRKFFHANVARESDEAGALRERLESMVHTEPEKESQDMFGETTTNPAWADWKSQRDTLAGEVNTSSLTWAKYADAMHGHENAYATMQDMIRSKVGESFNKHYNTLNPNAPLKLGRQVVRNNLNHLDTVDPKARVAREAKERALIDGLRERSQGKYAAGSVSDKLDAAREEQEAFNQSQMGFFSTEQEDMFGGGAEAEKTAKPLGADERHTLGHAAERTISAMMGVVGQNFKAGQPLKIFSPTMSGPDGVMRQRAIKIIEQNKRVALAAGTGAGKTAMMLGSFSHLQSQGKARRGLFLVPSIVQGQIGAEALRFMEPGKYNWHCEPGASRDERIAAYKDPKHHFTVMTHQSFRDDMLHLGAKHTGIDTATMSDRLDAMQPAQRSEWMKGVMAKEGINYDFLAADEAHNTLNRAGKENSAMANVVDSVSANSEFYIHSTADVVKNDLSEAADIMKKMDPKRYGDTAAFMRRYGVNTQGAQDALKRELIRHVLPFKIEPRIRADKREINVEPTETQNKALSELDKSIGKVRMARMEGKVDVEAMKAISPAQFKDAPEDQHEAIARELAKSIGIIKGSAVRAILDSGAGSAKIDALASLVNERKGKPGVVFAHSLEAVQNIKARLEKDGHRVMTLTGADSSADKAAKIRGFNPDKGDRTHDIIVCSDAGATGANLQSGTYLTQFDTPMTAMTHAQRQGRINRIGQKNDVELLDLVANHPSERKARERLKTKYELRELMSSSMEGLDDTGLAAFIHQRKVAEQQESMF